MNENDKNIDPMRDAAPDVEHLRLEISEKRRSVLSHWWCYIDDVTKVPTKVPTTPFFLFFFCEQEKGAKEVFCFFKVVLFEAARFLVVLSEYTINNKQ